MAWELIDCPHGTVTNGDLLEIYKLLSASTEEKHKALAERLNDVIEVAKHDKKRKDEWLDDGGPAPPTT